MSLRQRRSAQRPPIERARLGVRWLVVAGAAAAMVIGLLPGAAADDPTIPTQDDVEAAEQHVETTADAVGRIKSELVAAEENVRLLELSAQKAVEAYNGAVYELDRSHHSLRRAERVSGRAMAGVRRLQASIATTVVGDSMDGGPLADLGVLLQDPDPGALMDQLSSYRGFTGAMDNELDTFDAQRIVAEVLAEQAQGAFLRSELAAERMEAARLQAQKSLTRAEQAATGLEARKDELVVELAEAQDISVGLARQRQRALAERAARQARLRAEQQALEQAAREDWQQDRLDARRQASGGAQQDRPAQRGHRPGKSGDDGGSAPSAGVEAAVAFALAQVGEPYEWGAAGPDAWDCSGFTMGAWGASGRALPHYSVAQYDAVSPVSMSTIRRGDLLFWSDGGPSSIFHVALYLGDGMMVHAPRTGRDVEIVSMYYWIAPDLAGRL